MSPILVRPVREQLEHDRVIRLLQAKSRRKYDAGINPGAEQNVPVGTGPAALFPDVVLNALDRGRKVEAVIEVETGESVNHLEALAEWAHFARLRTPFHLYVPSTMVEVAKRLCDDNHIVVSEIWSYHGIGDDVRFTLVHRTKEAAPARRQAAPPGRRAARAAVTAKPTRAVRPARPARSTPSATKAPKRAVAKKATRLQKRK